MEDTNDIFTGSVSADDLRADLKTLVQNQDITDRQLEADRLRLCEWDGQSNDGRKHAEDLGEEPAPFEGATDSRVRLADTVVIERKSMLMTAALQAYPMFRGIESGDEELAARMRTLMIWLRDNALAPMVQRELSLAAEWFTADDPPVAIIGVFWDQQKAVGWRVLKLEEIVAGLAEERMISMAGQIPDQEAATKMLQEVIAEVRSILFDESREEEALGLIGMYYPNGTKGKLLRCLKDLRETGAARFPHTYLKRNLPKWVAYRLNESIFVPTDSVNPEDWDRAYVNEWLSRPELEARAEEEEWPTGVYEAILASPNASLVPERTKPQDESKSEEVAEGTDEVATDRWEVWTCWRRQAEDDAIGVYRSVFGGNGELAIDELIDEEHGEMPFVVASGELLSRNLADGRGVPNLLGTHQSEIKTQRDTRGDHAMLTTAPPMKVQMRRAGFQMSLGPWSEIPVYKSDDIEPLKINAYPAGSIEMEDSVRREVNELIGRRVDEYDQVRVERIEALLTMLFMSLVRGAWILTLQLCQQYLSPKELQRIVGGKKALPEASQVDIQGQFDLRFYFDGRDANLDFLKLKLDYMQSLFAMDRTGVLDASKAVKFGALALDPQLADIIVSDEKTGTAREIKDEDEVMLKAAAGIPSEPLQGGNAQARLQRVQELLQQSPKLQALYQNEKDTFRELVDERVKNLQFLVEQYTKNPLVGKTGVKQRSNVT